MVCFIGVKEHMWHSGPGMALSRYKARKRIGCLRAVNFPRDTTRCDMKSEAEIPKAASASMFWVDTE